MAEQTSLVAQQVRLMHWAEQIRECQNRLEGMDVSTWCEQNYITKANQRGCVLLPEMVYE